MLNGLNVILSHHLTEPGEPRVRVRSWRERLLQPVKPLDLLRLTSLLRAEVIETPMVPSRQYFLLAGGSVVMHPAMWQSLKAALPKETNPSPWFKGE